MKQGNLNAIPRKQNPPAFTSGNYSPLGADYLGRLLTTPYQVRDLVATAQAQTATLAEVNLLGGATSTLHDLVCVTAANTTGAAVRVDIRDNAGGGNVLSIQLAANETKVVNLPVPIPQNEAANSWTIINGGSGDTSNTNIVVSALFIKNV